MDYHQRAKPDHASPNRPDARRRHKLRQHAASLATGVIVFLVSIGLMQAARPPVSSITVSSNTVSSSTELASPAPSSGGSGSSGAAATGAGSEESEPAPAPAPASGRAVPAPGPSTAAQIIGMPSVYIHVLNENAREQARLLAPALEKHGIALAGIKVVNDGPRSSDLRYFRPSEKEEAMKVQAVLLSLGLPARRLKSISGFETSAVPRQYELWLSADYKG